MIALLTALEVQLQCVPRDFTPKLCHYRVVEGQGAGNADKRRGDSGKSTPWNSSTVAVQPDFANGTVQCFFLSYGVSAAITR